MSRLSNTISARRKRKLFVVLRERYGDDCHWCGKPMDFGDAREKPLSATIEHLVPRSDGGTDEESNLRLAHKRCNEDRSFPPPKRTLSPFYVLVNA